MKSLWLWIAKKQNKLRPVGAMVVRNKSNKFLLVKKPRKDNAWQFPQGGLDAGETFYQGALRELREECGANIEVESNQKKVGEFCYFFPKNFKRPDHKFVGAQVCFFKAKFLSGEIELDVNELEDFVWAEASEIEKKVSKKYWNIIKKFL